MPKSAFLFFAGLTLISAVANAQTAWREDFDGQQTSWLQVGRSAQSPVVQQKRVPQGVYPGSGCEWLQIQTGGGQTQLEHNVARPAVIDDLAVSLWLKSDRPGINLELRVALPRSRDPATGRPMQVVLTGPAYSDVGRWQQLRMTGITTLLNRQVHLLRLQAGPSIDPREAFVEAVLLSVSGGSGTVNIWTDQLEIAGHASVCTNTDIVRATAHQQQTENVLPPAAVAASGSALGPLVPVRLPPVERTARPAQTTADSPPKQQVRLTGSILTVNGRPMFPRIIQHCGEPLEFLKRLGFNTVWLSRPPAPEILEEAERLGLWLVCPPPRGTEPINDIGPPFDAVLAWNLGNDLIEADLEPVRQWGEQVRAADRRGNRPLVCRPRADLRGFSRACDVLLIDRRPLGTSLELTNYAAWVQRQPLLARPGTPIWTTVQTQPNETLLQQIAALEPSAAPPLCVPSEQMRLLAYTAVASGSRGLLFASNSPLDATDPYTQQRAMALELLNLELELIEPWAAAGSFVAAADTGTSEVVGAVLRTDRARLLLPIWSAPRAQCTPPQSAANNLSLVVPGVPEATNAYELTPNGIMPLRHKRVAGGMRVVLEEFGLTTQVLLAHDPAIVGAVSRRAVQIGRRAAELQRNLAVRKLHTTATVAAELGPRTPVASAADWFDAARLSLQTCDTRYAAGDAPGAALYAQRAMRSLRLVERAFWEAAQRGLASPVTSPGAVGFDTLTWHWQLADRLGAERFGQNLIAGGDFEDMQTMMRAGWRYVQAASPAIQTAADLAPGAARSGRLGLRLAAAAIDPQNPPAVVESPPVLFTSPTVQVAAGQVVCIHGWARVPGPITGSIDGLLIVDSITGEALADRIGPTGDWRQFALYRVVPQTGPMCVNFALSGLGEAHIDDVVIQVGENTTPPVSVDRQ